MSDEIKPEVKPEKVEKKTRVKKETPKLVVEDKVVVPNKDDVNGSDTGPPVPNDNTKFVDTTVVDTTVVDTPKEQVKVEEAPSPKPVKVIDEATPDKTLPEDWKVNPVKVSNFTV